MLRIRMLGMVCGLLAAVAALGAAEGFAALIGSPSPVVAVGTWAIDTAPTSLREFAIKHFGVNDKTVLVLGVLATVALFGSVAGLLGVTRRRLALGLTAATGTVGLLAVITVRGATDALPVRMAPALLALAISTIGLAKLLSALRPGAPEQPVDAAIAAPRPGPARARVTERPAAPPVPTVSAATSVLELPAVMIPGRHAVPEGIDRRAFVRSAGALGAIGLTGGALRQFSGPHTSLTTAKLVALPRPTSPSRTVTGADFRIPGLSPYFTPNSDFYRIDTSLVIPRLDAATWQMRVHGMVDNPITITYADLLKAPLIERDVTLMCVSNEVGDHYTGNARWLGVRIADVLKAAGVRAGADAVKSKSVDGWTSGTPLSALTDPNRDAMFAIGMNGVPLPFDHGFPVRMVVPGLYGFVSATKWLVDFEVTRFDAFEAYWTKRGWSPQGPIKTESRIEVPSPGSRITAGRSVLAGMAWAQHRGISKVEVGIDGKFVPAELAPWSNPDTWRQWRILDWEPTVGTHQLAVRATDGSGVVQTAVEADVLPDGATGYHKAQIKVI